MQQCNPVAMKLLNIMKTQKFYTTIKKKKKCRKRKVEQERQFEEKCNLKETSQYFFILVCCT